MGAALSFLLLAVAGVDQILREQQFPGDGEALQVGGARMLQHHGPAELEPREVPFPGGREQVESARPGLQPPVHLGDFHLVDGGRRPISEPGDGAGAPGPERTGEVLRTGKRSRDGGGTRGGGGVRTGHRGVRGSAHRVLHNLPGHSTVLPSWTFSRMPTASGTRIAIE